MSRLPTPLTPPDCDLRGYDFMPLFGHRLFSSEFYVRASDAGFRAGIRLWWAAWQQCPAASLPDDDRLLCRLADFGRDVDSWMAVREEALHGFIRCSDGRLYHKLLAEEAVAAWDRRRKERQRKAKLRADRAAAVPRDIGESPAGQGEMSRGHDTGHDTGQNQGQDTGCPAGQDAEVPSDRTGQDRTGQDLKKEPPNPQASLGEQNRSRSGYDPPRRSRAAGTNPRAIAAAEAAARPPPPEPEHPLWAGMKARGMSPLIFASSVGRLAQTPSPNGHAVWRAPSRFLADHIRAQHGAAIEAVVGRPVAIVFGEPVDA